MAGISKVEQLEKEYCKFSGYKYAIAVNSGTSALTLAVRALGIGKGDEVIMPDFTMIATKWAVDYNSAKPVIVDIGDDLNIDVSKIKVNKKTKAIMPVDMYGRLPDVKALKKFGLPIIEDACEAHGAFHYGDIVCLSFFKNKIIHGEEGGICLTNDEKLADRMKWLKCMAFGDGKEKYKHTEIGFNFRMPESQAVLVLKSLRGFYKEMKRRRNIEKELDSRLLTSPQKYRQAPWIYDIILDRDSAELFDLLLEKGVSVRPFFYPIAGKEKALKAWKNGFYLQFDDTYKKAINIINKYVQQTRKE